MAGAHQRERAGDLLLAWRAARAAAATARARRPAPGGGGRSRCAVSKPGVAGSSCRSCSSMHSPTERAPTPGGSSACTPSSTALDLGGVALDLGLQRAGDLLQRLGEVAVVADGIDDGARDRQLARLEAWRARAATAGAPAATGRRRRRTPAGARRRRRSRESRQGRRCARPSPRRRPRRCSRRGALGGLGAARSAVSTASKVPVPSALVHGLEHHVRLEQLADVGLQLEGGQLQEPDRLLQLRGHGQLLTQLQLQRRFQHGEQREALGAFRCIRN